MVKQALERIQQTEEEARVIVEAARKEVASDLLQANEDAEAIVKEAEAEAREQSKAILAEAEKESQDLSRQIRDMADKETSELRQNAQQRSGEAIRLIKERFVGQWQ